MPKTSRSPENFPLFADNDDESAVEDFTLPEDNLIDAITGNLVKDTAKERVRQRIIRALHMEYGIPFADMESDFAVPIGGRKKKKLDIAIFRAGNDHTCGNISRAVVCRQEPKVSATTVRIRDYDQAEKDLEGLNEIMEELDSCEYGLWTNGLEFFYLRKRAKRFETAFEPIGDWPPIGDTELTLDTPTQIVSRRADPDMLRIAFRRCHNFIHGNEGMPKDAAFWQFLYLIFCKIHDELTSRNRADRRFWVGPKEQFEELGQRRIRERITPLFTEVKDKYKSIFRGSEEISLSNRALAFMVSELSKYDLSRTEVDAKGAAYQEIVGTNLRGDRGQYFTPRKVVSLAVKMIAPRENERIFDPACGTGGFLVGTVGYVLDCFRQDANVEADTETTEEFDAINRRLRRFAENSIYGADFDPFLIKASQMNMVMAGDGHGHLYHLNSLEFPKGHLNDLDRARVEIALADTDPRRSFDVIMTNPPFGSDIPITDRHILEQYDLAYRWERLEDGNYRKGNLQSSVNPEKLFIERCVQWLKPGGRMAIVLPNGILGNPGDEYIRWWIMKNTWVLASVELPVEVFIVEANVNIQTSLLFLKKKTQEEILAEQLTGRKPYPVFMAVAEKVGFDRRGNRLYKRTPDGEEKIETSYVVERIQVNGNVEERRIPRRAKIEDDDLPEIAQKYREFVKQYSAEYPHLQTL